jgi:hypothetical protein
MPVECSIPNSNMGDGEACRCKDGFAGEITWNAGVASGECQPAACDIKNSNKQDGLFCACSAGFEGKITWNKDKPAGECVAR